MFPHQFQYLARPSQPRSTMCPSAFDLMMENVCRIEKVPADRPGPKRLMKFRNPTKLITRRVLNTWYKVPFITTRLRLLRARDTDVVVGRAAATVAPDDGRGRRRTGVQQGAIGFINSPPSIFRLFRETSINYLRLALYKVFKVIACWGVLLSMRNLSFWLNEFI